MKLTNIKMTTMREDRVKAANTDGFDDAHSTK